MLFVISCSILGRGNRRGIQIRRNRRRRSWGSHDHVQLQVRQGLPGAQCGAVPGEQRRPAAPDWSLPAYHGLRLLEVRQNWRYCHFWPLLQVTLKPCFKLMMKMLNLEKIPSRESLPFSLDLVTASNFLRTSTTVRPTSRISALFSQTL